MPSLALKWPICSDQNFFGTNHYYYFHLPIGPFRCAKISKILAADPESLGCAISRPKMVHSLQTKNVLEKFFNIIFIYLLATFIVQNAKKNSYSGSRVMRMCHLWVQNGPFAQMRIFSENLLISPVLIYMPKIKVRFSSVNEILIIKEC